MSSAKLTLIGLNYYMKSHDNDLFGLLTLPDGIEKEILTDNILLTGGEFEVLYSDPNFLKDAIGLWGKKWQRTFEKWVKALSVEYNPLENYDRIEEWTDNNTGTVSDNGFNNSSSINHTSGNNNGSSSDNISAYNSDTMRPDSSSNSHDDYSSSGDSSNNATNGNTRTDDLTSQHNGRMHGNIGVTTSQQMLESELDIAKWNIYEHITDLFLQEFVIPLF